MSDTKDEGIDASGTFFPDVAGSAPHAPEDTYPATGEVTIYPAAGQEQATAQALLAAADDPRQVQYFDGAFVVPQDVADAATLPEDTEMGPELDQTAQDAALHSNATKTSPAKRAPAKKAPAKKAAAKPSDSTS